MFGLNALMLAPADGIFSNNLQLRLDASLYTSGTTWADASGNGYDYTFGDGTNNKPTFTSSGAASYMAFSSSQYFQQSAANSGSIMRTAGRNDKSFTIEAWYYHKTGADGTIFDSTNNAGGNNGIQFRSTKSSANKPYLDPAPLYPGTGVATNAMSDATWYQAAWAGKCDGSTITAYLNGATNGTFTANNSGWSAGDSTATPRLGLTGAGTIPLIDGSRIGVFLMYDADIGSAGISQNYAAFQARGYA